MINIISRKYEEHAYILDYETRQKSLTVNNREGIIITALGEDRLTLLEILGMPNTTFDVGEILYIGKEGRTKVLSVLGKISYDKISITAQNELNSIIEKIVIKNEQKFVDYINNAQPLTPRIHALELIPGIGKTYMNSILTEIKKKKFDNFDDLCNRVGFKEPIQNITKRIMSEITGKTRMRLFVKR